MRIVVSKHFTVPCRQYGNVRIGYEIEVTEEDFEFDPTDRRDPMDIALERATEAVNSALGAEFEVLKEQDVADDPTFVTKIIKTL